MHTNPHPLTRSLALLLVALFALAACVTTHVPATPAETLALNYKTIETLAESTANSVRIGSVSAEKAKNVVEILEQAYQVNKMAETAIAAGQVADGQTYLQTTSEILTQVEVLLK